jgi:hypothetical protein
MQLKIKYFIIYSLVLIITNGCHTNPQKQLEGLWLNKSLNWGLGFEGAIVYELEDGATQRKGKYYLGVSKEENILIINGEESTIQLPIVFLDKKTIKIKTDVWVVLTKDVDN